jgi:hypothetical protein
MKRVETYRGSGEYVNAVQDADLERLRPVFAEAQREWFAEWVARGQRDEGSCCMGVGISVYYLPPRARQPQRRQVIAWTWSQGDLEADRTQATPINRIAQHGASATYDWGRMD